MQKGGNTGYMYGGSALTAITDENYNLGQYAEYIKAGYVVYEIGGGGAFTKMLQLFKKTECDL